MTTVLTVSTLSAKSYVAARPDQDAVGKQNITIIQYGQDQITGNLIDADASYYVFENTADEAVQVIARSAVDLLETNLGVNLLDVLKHHDPAELSDRIELNDGTQISCIILDMSNDQVQYFTGQSLKRQVVSADRIYNLYLGQAAVDVPFPVLQTSEQAI